MPVEIIRNTSGHQGLRGSDLAVSSRRVENVRRKWVLSVEDGAGWEGSSQHTTTFPDLGLPLVRSVTQQLLSAGYVPGAGQGSADTHTHAQNYTLASSKVLTKSHLFSTLPLGTCRRLGMLCACPAGRCWGQVGCKEE